MAGGQVYEVTSTDRSQDVEIIATYVERDILQSGWLLGEQVIAKKAAAVTVKHGAGKVVLIGFRPQHRDQTHGTFKLVFNALLNGPSHGAAGDDDESAAVAGVRSAGLRFHAYRANCSDRRSLGDGGPSAIAINSRAG